MSEDPASSIFRICDVTSQNMATFICRAVRNSRPISCRLCLRHTMWIENGHNCSTWQLGDAIILTTRVESLSSADSSLNNVQLSLCDCINGTRATIPNCVPRVAFINDRMFDSFVYYKVTYTKFMTGQVKILRLWKFPDNVRSSIW